MADLQPDVKKFYKWGTNARTPLDLLGGERYRLLLCPEVNGPRAVLVVQMFVQFQFKDGEGGTPATKGKKLTWTQPEKEAFAAGFRTMIGQVWNDRYRITTTSPAVPERYRDVGVQFAFRTQLDGWNPFDDYELGVAKIDTPWNESWTNTHFQNVELNSEDLTPYPPGGAVRQRGAAHEFGHMLGLRDEYPEAPNPAPAWTGDAVSVMHSGETVQPRHYTPFARWLTEQFSAEALRNRTTAEFKVDRVWTTANSRL